MGDINRITNGLEHEQVQLHPKDEISMKMWLSVLHKQGANTFCKDKVDVPPPGSQLADDLVILVVQTKFQSDVFRRLGSSILCIDGTHNTTCYSVQLLTIMVRDQWGHGMQSILCQ